MYICLLKMFVLLVLLESSKAIKCYICNDCAAPTNPKDCLSEGIGKANGCMRFISDNGRGR